MVTGLVENTLDYSLTKMECQIAIEMQQGYNIDHQFYKLRSIHVKIFKVVFRHTLGPSDSLSLPISELY